MDFLNVDSLYSKLQGTENTLADLVTKSHPAIIIDQNYALKTQFSGNLQAFQYHLAITPLAVASYTNNFWKKIIDTQKVMTLEVFQIKVFYFNLLLCEPFL